LRSKPIQTPRVKSKELTQGKEHIRHKLKEKGKMGNADFYELALEIENYFGV
jgi:putative hydrolase of HD superfamily